MVADHNLLAHRSSVGVGDGPRGHVGDWPIRRIRDCTSGCRHTPGARIDSPNGHGLGCGYRSCVSGGCLVRARAREHRRRHRRDYCEGDLLKLHASTVGMSAGDGENLITDTSRVARILSGTCFLSVAVYLATMRKTTLVLIAALGACALPPPPPPAAEFLVSAGDQTYWVRSDNSGSRSAAHRLFSRAPLDATTRSSSGRLIAPSLARF